MKSMIKSLLAYLREVFIIISKVDDELFYLEDQVIIVKESYMNNPIDVTRRQTICWDCKNAYGHCSWSNGTFTPVKGWDAVYKPIKYRGDETIESYVVLKCPLFEVG